MIGFRQPDQMQMFIDHPMSLICSRLGATAKVASCPDENLADLSAELLSSYRLTRELQIEGMSMEGILNVYQRSDLKPFMIRDILRRWKTYTNEEGYNIMLMTLERSSFDIVHIDMHLTRLYDLKVIEFSNALDILLLSDYDIVGTSTNLIGLWTLLSHEPKWTLYGRGPCKQQLLHHKAYSKVLEYFHGRPNGLAKACSNLTNLRNLLCFEPEWARKYNVVRYLSSNPDLPSIPIGNLDFILEAIDAFEGDVPQVHDEFLSVLKAAGLTERFPSVRRGLDLSPKDILNASNMVFELWRSNGFNTPNALGSWPTNDVQVAKVVMSSVLWVAAYCPSSHDSLVDQLYEIWPVEKLYWGTTKPEYLSLPHWELMRRYGYNLARIGDVRQTLEASFPTALVDEGYHWIWFIFNNFDIEVTKSDATLMPTTFPWWGRDERILEIKRMHRARGLNITYKWETFARTV
ncbi:SubName: Full=Related to endo-1,3(4)-beta-glucanase {ECO:0000313/EMBL:CCA75248.1} [Serendipita indica DSM 11827]|nr:SubName: Full=Related to endo-1,3(4)-beta-glucanase {ECO:0000313/EMBL:CCA75248.1} [Serendipita indica DSM 11827]